MVGSTAGKIHFRNYSSHIPWTWKRTPYIFIGMEWSSPRPYGPQSFYLSFPHPQPFLTRWSEQAEGFCVRHYFKYWIWNIVNILFLDLQRLNNCPKLLTLVSKRHSQDWNPGIQVPGLVSSPPPTLLSSKQWLNNQKPYIQCLRNAFYCLVFQTSD